MVERLKAAIEKARERRNAGAPTTVPSGDTPASSAASAKFTDLQEVVFDEDALIRNRMVSYHRMDQAYFAFDILRTRLLKVCKGYGWRRVGITSPTKGCGKTTVLCNLAFSLARHPSARTVVLDLDLRGPAMARRLAVRTDVPITAFLQGHATPESFLQRFGTNLAFGFNGVPEPNPAEFLQSTACRESLETIARTLNPDLVLFDLPPMLVADDALAALELVDAVLLIAAAGETRHQHIRECEHLMESGVPLIGVVLNKCEQDDISGYQYEYTDV
ncbi:MAG: CpsD/CapB family tyrosine-protein kinase [Halieaceae bacterium]|jgi:Mrp family chromosome partitioning ATPase|nr:CpsD/CapB family tyrosine-protein kinase [Halieaceae bacterium]